MDFYDVVAQIVHLLQQQGRATYRGLKLQFKLDDDTLEALKEEILYSRPEVLDDEGRGLIWTGSTEASSVTSSQPYQLEPPPIVEQAQPVQATLPPIEPHTPEAERRQLTVMFVDIVESTALAGELDPEDYRDVVRRYQRVCAEVIQRYDGHIAQYLGDGLLVYFGFPQAHEDDAQRAVHTGLGIIDAIGTLNTRLEQDKGVELAIRLGIHTGLVVVGEIGGDGRQEQLALGETPNIAARIQSIAEPDMVVMSADTYRLIQGYFDCESLGEHVLRGVSQPMVVYRVLGDTGIQSRLDVASARGLTPLIGREREVDLLLDRWEQAKDGQGQVILLSGEAGIGKSRLVQALKDHIAEAAHIWLECRSSPYFSNSALYPITDFLQRTLRFQSDDTPEQKLEKLTHNLSQYHLPLEESVPLFAALLSLPVPEDRYPSLNLTPQRQRQKTLEAIVAILLEQAERQPMLFILEDLHWTDPTTLEFLDLLIDQTPTASICALLTCRSEFQPSWSHRSYLTEVTVNRLSQPQIERMAEQVVGDKRLPAEVIQQLVDKTDGVPLYVEEMTKAVLESGVLKETNGHYELVGSVASLAIPATLQDSLMARLDRLVTAKAVAQYAAVIGRQFSYELLRDVSPLDEAILQWELGRLVDAELVYQQGLPPQATYMFKHALIQDIAYESLLRSTRQGYHRRIAEVLEDQFPETVETQPELLAHHYTEASLHEQAVGYWQRAGQRAVERSAHIEAIRYLNHGLEILKTLRERVESPEHELALQTTLGQALKDTKGYGDAEVASVYKRVRELCQEIPEAPQLFQALLGQSIYFVVTAELQTAYELGEQLLSIAQRTQDAVHLVEAHYALGVTSFWLGKFVLACEHLEQGVIHYDSHKHRLHIALFGQDGGAVCLCRLAATLWYLGYPNQSLLRSHEALTLARNLSHPFSTAYVKLWVAWLHHHRREIQRTQEMADTVTAWSTEQGFPYWSSQGDTLQGWLEVQHGQIAAGIAHIQQGLADLQATGTELLRPFYLSLLADAYGKSRQTVEGVNVLDEALTLVAQYEERWYEAEIHRLKGELLLQQSANNAVESETCFYQALDIARSQQAKSWELRAATSLARLWQSQGKREEARELLEPVYSWFSEGFDTADLIDAKALLDDLTEGSS